MPPAVDLPRLAAASDGTPAGMRTLAEMFLTDVGETVDELAAAVLAGRPGDIELLAHRAGGACASCGAARLAELLLNLENLGRAGRAGGTAAIMGDVAEEAGRVRAFLRDWLGEDVPTVG